MTCNRIFLRTCARWSIMDIADVCEATALKAHVVMPDEGRPLWEACPDAWGRPWMTEAIREGRVATIGQAAAAAWYDGGRKMRPRRAR